MGAAAQLFLTSLSFAGGSMSACLHESYMASVAQGIQVHGRWSRESRNGGRRHILIEPLVVVRKYLNSWGKRKIDLKELYDLRFKKGLLWRELIARLGISRSTLIDNLKKAQALYGRVDREAHENIGNFRDRTHYRASDDVADWTREDRIFDFKGSHPNGQLGQPVTLSSPRPLRRRFCVLWKLNTSPPSVFGLPTAARIYSLRGARNARLSRVFKLRPRLI